MNTSTDNSMASLHPTDTSTPRDPAAVTNRFLLFAAVAIGVLTVAGLVVGIIGLRWPVEWPGQLLPMMAWLMIGLTGAALCSAVILLVRLLRALLDEARSMDQRLTALAQVAFAQTSVSTAKTEAGPDLVEVRRLLADIREIMLLPEAQRLARFQNLLQVEVRRRLALADQYIDAREFHRAREEHASLVDRFGRSEDVRRGEERLLAAMRAALQEDVETATRKIADLMTMARWEQAEQYARELTQKYPEASDPRQLLQRVQEERVLFDRRHRQRMHDEIQQFVNQRRWREAASAAEMFIQTFPTGVDTDALQQQLDTLKANAQIEIRQQLERHIKEYVARKDYWDALELARRIITEYPFSPQASALRMQLPRIEELARQQGVRS